MSRVPLLEALVWEGQSRAGSPLSIADPLARIQREMARNRPVFASSARRAEPTQGKALKYQTGTRLRDLMRARQRLKSHVPALTIFTRTPDSDTSRRKPATSHCWVARLARSSTVCGRRRLADEL